MKNIVVPIIIMKSPGADPPALTNSAAASAVPAITGVPTGIPVSKYASFVTVPAILVVHMGKGNFSGGTRTSESSSCHLSVLRLKRGVKAAAV